MRPFVLVLFLSAQAFAQPCGPFPSCLYTPSATYSVGLTTAVVTYTDAAGLQRSVPIAIRRPVGKTGPLPVVIWMHGGFQGSSNPLAVMGEWSTVTAEAGYLSIASAHSLRGVLSSRSLCAALGGQPGDCASFHSLNWDRPKDVSAIIDELSRMNAQGPLSGQIDLNRIAVGGHSAGSAATMSVAGAGRFVIPGAPPVTMTDPRPIAFIGMSPQGPGHLGFFETDFRRPETSWDNVSRPVLTATGDGDAICVDAARDVCEHTPSLRRIAFERMPAPNKYLMYIRDARTPHSLFSLRTSECQSNNVPAATCNAFASWLQATVLAFLDFHVNGRPAAGVWLQKPFLNLASAGIADLENK